jgi:hypothetical protein
MAWWAVDYHFDWLYAALHTDSLAFISNKFPVLPNGRSQEPKLQFIQGQQEDIDLIVSSGRDVVLIEAKAFSEWDPKQIKSKIARLKLLCKDPGGIVHPEKPIDEQIALHFVLLYQEGKNSPDPALWPKWTRRGSGELYTLKLMLSLEQTDFLKVTRCDNGDRSKNNRHDFWRVVPNRARTAKTGEHDRWPR